MLQSRFLRSSPTLVAGDPRVICPWLVAVAERSRRHGFDVLVERHDDDTVSVGLERRLHAAAES